LLKPRLLTELTDRGIRGGEHDRVLPDREFVELVAARVVGRGARDLVAELIAQTHPHTGNRMLDRVSQLDTIGVLPTEGAGRDRDFDRGGHGVLENAGEGCRHGTGDPSGVLITFSLAGGT
jgi:hypothetical protein